VGHPVYPIVFFTEEKSSTPSVWNVVVAERMRRHNVIENSTAASTCGVCQNWKHWVILDTKIQRGTNKNSKLQEGKQWIEQKPRTYFPATSKT
jgi:hypothetical protein